MAVTLFLILVLGASAPPHGAVISGRAAAGAILQTWVESENRADERALVGFASTSAAAGRVVVPRAAFVAPRFGRADAHGRPPARAPTICRATA